MKEKMWRPFIIKKDKLEKEIKEIQDLLTDGRKLVEKKLKASQAANILVSHPSLWDITNPKWFTKAKHQLFLKLSFPGSEVLSKNESKNIKVLQDKKFTYL